MTNVPQALAIMSIKQQKTIEITGRSVTLPVAL